MIQYGFIKLYRSLLNWEWYKDANTLQVFIHLLLTVNYKDDYDDDGNFVHRGERYVSLRELSTELEMPLRQLRTAVEHLKTSEVVSHVHTNRHVIFKVNNFEKYQAIMTDTQNGTLTDTQTDTQNFDDTDTQENCVIDTQNFDMPTHKKIVENGLNTNDFEPCKSNTDTLNCMSPTHKKWYKVTHKFKGKPTHKIALQLTHKPTHHHTYYKKKLKNIKEYKEINNCDDGDVNARARNNYNFIFTKNGYYTPDQDYQKRFVIAGKKLIQTYFDHTASEAELKILYDSIVEDQTTPISNPPDISDRTVSEEYLKLLEVAFYYAVKSGNPNLSYVSGIIRKNRNRDVLTVKEFEDLNRLHDHDIQTFNSVVFEGDWAYGV